MIIKLKYFLAVLFFALIANSFNYAVAAEDEGIGDEEVESAEIALMRLQLEYGCEISPGCKEKNKEHLGKKKVKFKTYKKGTATSLAVLKVKGEAEVVDVRPDP